MCLACPGRTEMALPLSGLLVVSVEQAVAAPQCTCRLADAGARVIKVERPEGDFAREYDHVVHGESANFVWLNRGKQSVVLDLGKSGDRALLEAMLAKADVFVQNLKPGAIAKLGFAMSRLRKDYPRLICCSISGYGEGGVPFRRIGLAHAAIAPYGVFKTRDGADILIAIQNDREWRVLADKVLGDAALGTDAKFSTNPKRVENRTETDAKVAACFARHDVAALMKQLESADIAFARVNDWELLSKHAHLRRITVGAPSGLVSMPAPAPLRAGQERNYGPIPALGAHTAMIRREFSK